MANKIILFTVLFLSAVLLVSLQGGGLVQAGDNSKINKQEASQKELTVDQKLETKSDRKIKPVQGLRIVETRENQATTEIKATDLTRKEPAPSVATDK